MEYNLVAKGEDGYQLLLTERVTNAKTIFSIEKLGLRGKLDGFMIPAKFMPFVNTLCKTIIKQMNKEDTSVELTKKYKVIYVQFVEDNGLYLKILIEGKYRGL